MQSGREEGKKEEGKNQIFEKPTAAERGLGCREQDRLGASAAAWEPPVPKPLGQLLKPAADVGNVKTYITINSSVHLSASFKYFLGTFYESMGGFFFLFVKLVPLLINSSEKKITL